MKYEIERVDNGWIVSWCDQEDDEKWVDHAVVWVDHAVVFEIPDECDTTREDPQALIDLLLFVKEEIGGQYYSKHKQKNAVIRFEEEDEVA